ncbi:MAG: hypothetical protein IJ087_11580 [Eggerthellaceae bacterium]|nr:hypothetical protein [Eggerthellaceae bacterium]
MNELVDGARGPTRFGRWGWYLLKASALVAVLFAVSRFAPAMPAWALGLVWALLSAIPATGVTYHAVIAKTARQRNFQEKSHLGRVNNGRIVCFVLSYAASALLVAGFIAESPTWSAAMWVSVTATVPIYLAVSTIALRVVSKEATPLLQESYAALASALITGALACVAFALATYALPHPAYTMAAQAFMEAPKPFAGSPSALASEVGDLSALVGGLSSYALTKAADGSFGSYVALLVAVNGGAFFGIAGQLAVCSIRPGELKRIFFRLESLDGHKADMMVLKRFVVTSIVLPLMLAGGFCYADARAGEIVQTGEYTMAQKIIREQVSLAVYTLDGKRYDLRAVDDLLAQAREESDRLAADAEATLVPLVNASFDARVANVDGYLDWYYSLFADWEQLASMVTGSAEDFMTSRLEEKIEQGIDDSELNAALEGFVRQAELLKVSTLEKLSEYEIPGDYPDWIVSEKVQLGELFDRSVEPSQKFLDATSRAGISVAASVAAGVITKKLLTKLVGKSFFKAVAGRIAGLAGASAASTIGGPVVIAFVVIGGVIVDVGLLKAEELMNRESYRNEIVATIEEQRAEALSAIRGIAPV